MSTAPAPCSPATPREIRYQSLLETARGLLLITGVDDLVRHILSHGPAILECAALSLYLPDPKTKELVIYSARGGTADDAHVHTAHIGWDVGIAGRVFQTGVETVLDDAHQDAAFLGRFDAKSSFQTKAVLCVPVSYKKERLGVVQALNPLHGGSFDDFDRTLMQGIVAMVASALMRLDREREAKTMARIAGELAAAEEIQRALLPPPEVRFPNGLVLARYQPARTLGGDFYSAHRLADGSILAALGDVSGKGIPAALTTTQVITEIAALVSHSFGEGDLAAFVTALNRQLCGRLALGRFIATTFLHYRPASGGMEIVCAGQFPPWRRVEGSWSRPVVPAGPPLGIDAGARFEGAVLSSRPGELWMLASDGIVEGRSANREEYGLDRFDRFLARATGDPFRTLDDAWNDWLGFVVPDALHDDACLLLFAPLPDAEKEFPSGASSCKVCRGFIEDWACAAGFNDEERGLIVLAMDEAFTNLIRHGHKAKTGDLPAIFVRGALDPAHMKLVLRTQAPFFDLSRAQPQEIVDWKEQRLGGLGLHYIQAAFDAIECRPDGAFSETSFLKEYPRRSAPAAAP